MSAASPVDLSRLMTVTAMVGRTDVWIAIAHFDQILADVVLTQMMLSVLHAGHQHAPVLDGRMDTGWTVLVWVVGMFRIRVCGHCPTP